MITNQKLQEQETRSYRNTQRKLQEKQTRSYKNNKPETTTQQFKMINQRETRKYIRGQQ